MELVNKNVKTEPKKEEEVPETTFDFEALQKKNNEIKERLAKERAQANKSVLRSYNIKK